ncbi:MAG: NAD(+) diphosphatase [Clostridiales bacterium]|nr:NAD(+) diphosphatase [Clostridiales bacterium]
MIQDIFPHKLYNHYDPDSKPGADSIVIALRGNDVLISGDLFPMVKDLPEISTDELVYLFSVDDENHYFLLDVDDIGDMKIPEGYEFVNVRKFRSMGFPKKYRVFVAFTALQLANWYRNNRFCGRCGGKTRLDDKERAIRCECGNVIYPRIVPAVIVGVTNGDKLLVTKYRTGFAHFALVAGFTEIGETLEETVAREVMEETGLKVKNIRYYKSQPWGIVDDILVGFYCDVDGDDTITMDESELKVAEWRTRDDIEFQPDDFSLTNEMMKVWAKGEI